MRHRTYVSFAVLAAIALAVACADTDPVRTTAPVTVDGRIPVFAGTAGPKYVLPTGKGLDVAFDPNPPARTKNKLDYHNGPIMPGTQHIYTILYGTWGDPDTSTNANIVTYPLWNFCGQPYTNMWRAYTDYLGRAPLGCILFSPPVVDAYSHGATLSDADVADIVRQQLAANPFLDDPDAIFLVISSVDVANPGYGVTNCGWHGRFDYNGVSRRIGYLGWPERAATNCAPFGVGPNGTVGADANASHIIGLLSDIVTDPDLNAWSDKIGLEMADKCVWTYGTTYEAPNGKPANLKLGARDFLLQQLWVPNRNGGVCAMRP